MNEVSDSKQGLKIGVFDSGVAGLSIANAIKKALPDYEIIYREDSEHFSYGSRSPEQILRFVEPIFRNMVDEGCAIIVIACNTVTTTLLDTLRERLTVPLVGVEPMFEVAAQATQARKIAVCATPTTYASPLYRELKAQYAKDITVFEVECRDWPYMADRDPVDDIKVSKRIEEVLGYGVDVIVLACTHYHWIGEKIRYLSVQKATVIEPEEETVRRLQEVLVSLAL